jgi:flagellar biosynthesis/type III secretory pathway protein FliH
MPRVSLESFDASTVEQTGPSQSFEQGFVEGHAAGIAAAKAEQDMLRQEVVQSLADLEFKFNEARGEFIYSLAPFFEGLIEKVFPRLARDHFSEQIAAIMVQVAEKASVTKLHVKVHQSQRQAILSAVSESGIELTIEDDANLSETAALIRHEQHEILVDFDQLITEIGTVLLAVRNTDHRSEIYG